MQRTNRRMRLGRLMTTVFAVGFVASIFFTISAFAAANIFKIQNVEQTDISASAEGTITGFDEQTISSGVVFHRLNDYVEYTITLKNTDTSAHIIETITDDNSNPYIIYDYLNHQNEQINAGSDLVFVVTVRYVNQADMNDRVSVNNVKFDIKFLDIEEDDEVIVVPDTGANTSTSGGVSFSAISLIISALGLILICVLVMKKQKKVSRVIIALMICISAITFATTVKAEEASVNGFTFTTGFAFRDRLIVTYKDGNNNEHQEIISYGSLLNLENPVKNGYRFAGWKYADGSVFIASDPITDDISIEPVFTLDTYNISYDLAGGTTSEPNTTTYTVNDTVTLNEPTKAYYDFAGWTGTDLTEPTKNVVIPVGSTGDRSYTATYTPIDYSITYSNITSEELAPLNVPSTYNIETASFIIGKPATRVDGDGDPTYTFVGWKEGSTISETITLPDVNSMGPKTYEAQWAPVDAATYTISYELNGGTTATPNRTTFTKNDETFSIINPTKTGYTFKGWSGTDLTGDTNTNVQVVKGTRKSLSFEAHYTANTYKVIFDANNGSGSMADQTLTYDTAANLTTNIYTRFGYSFNGWNTEAGGTGTSYTDGVSVINLRTEGEITLYAQWTANSYLVAFDCNHVGCEGTIGNLPMVYDVEKALPLNAFSVPGYTFAGWNTKPTGDGDNYGNGATVNNLTAVGTITLYAKWTATPQSITYILGGGTANNPATYTIEESVTLNNPTREGYNFTGWSGTGLEGEENMEVVIPVGSIGERVYTAHWSPINYTITYVGLEYMTEEEFAALHVPTSYNVESVFTLNMPEKTGYQFDGWSGTGFDAPQLIVTITAGTTGDLTFEANFTPNKFVVIFDPNPGVHVIGGSMDSQEFTYDVEQALTKNAFTIDELGFKYGGWNTEADGSGTHYDDEEVVSNLNPDNHGSITLYAEWGRTPYSIAFDKNNDGASGEMATIENITYGEHLTLPACGFTYNDHKLASWNTEPDGSGRSYGDQADVVNVAVDGTITLYAQWRDIEAVFNTGVLVNQKIKALVDDVSTIQRIVHYEGTPDISAFTTNNVISSPNSPDLIYAWFDNGTVYYWSIDPIPALNANSSKLFAGFGSVTEIDLSNLDTSNARDLSYLFNGNGSLTSVDVSGFDTRNVTSLAYAFSQTGLQSVNLSNFNTPNLIHMECMFFRSKSLESITFGQNFNTSQVTDFTMLFMENKARELDLSMFNTSNVKNMYRMFRDCTLLESINLGNNFDTTNVTNMGEMFWRNQKLKSIDVSTWNTSNVTSMGQMFYGCESLESLEFGPGFDTSNVKNMDQMFRNCSSLKELDLSMFNTDKVTTMANMFLYDSNLETIKFGENFTTENVTSMQGMFEYCGKLKELDLSTFDTRNVTNMGYMFLDDGALTTIYVTDKFVVDQVVENNENSLPFRNNRVLVGGLGTTFQGRGKVYAHIDGGPENPGYFTDKNKLNIFFDANGGTGTMASQVNLPANTNVTLNPNQFGRPREGYVFGGWNTEPDGTGTHYDDRQIVNAYGRLVLYAQWGETPYTVIFDKNSEDATGTMESISKHYGERFNLPASGFERLDYDFKGWNTEADGTGIHYDDEQEVINLDEDGEVTLYAEWKEIVGLLQSGTAVNTALKQLANDSSVNCTYYDSNVLGIKRVYEMPELSSIDYRIISSSTSEYEVYAWFDDTTKYLYMYSDAKKIGMPKDSSYMFNNFLKAKEISLEGFSSNNTTNMDVLFGGCESVESLDLTPLNVSEVTSMYKMLKRLKKIKTIDMTGWDTSNVTDMSYMFEDDTELTTIIMGDKWNTEKVTRMENMFNGCNMLGDIDLTHFDTSNVENMAYMFSDCSSLSSLNLSAFDTSKVKDMSYMFKGCDGLTTIDISSFDTREVKNMSFMFQDCAVLETITTGELFKTDNVTNMYAMFADSPQIVNVDFSKFNTENVTNFQSFIARNKAMTTIDLSSFDTRSATNVSMMFQETNLVTIYVTNKFDVTGATANNGVFRFSNNLVGGSGTAYSDSHYTSEYARIDDPDNGKPGYFTDKN